jgi:hypothetical protein
LQHAKALVGEEHSLRFADAVNFYPATAQDARQLLPILDQIGDMPLGAITGALLKSLGRKLKPNACTDTWWREIVTPARAEELLPWLVSVRCRRGFRPFRAASSRA